MNNTIMRNMLFSRRRASFFLFICLLIFPLNNCIAQNKNTKMKSTNNSPERREKRRSDKVHIESPILVYMEVVKEKKGVVAKLKFTNISKEEVLVDVNKMGGDKLKQHIFHLNPWYTSPNLTFKPYSSLFSSDTVKEKYVPLKPLEVFETETNLSQYYDFQERKYEILTVIYLAEMKCLDKDLQQVTQTDIDGLVKSVYYNIESNQVKLNYEDIR